jgi:hypothetical protein
MKYINQGWTEKKLNVPWKIKTFFAPFKKSFRVCFETIFLAQTICANFVFIFVHLFTISNNQIFDKVTFFIIESGFRLPRFY